MSDESTRPSATRSGSRRPLARPDNVPRKIDWKDVYDAAPQLSDVEQIEAMDHRAPAARRRTHRAWYVLDVARTFSRGLPVIRLYQQSVLRRGDHGAVVPLPPRAIDGLCFADPLERRLVQLLCATDRDRRPSSTDAQEANRGDAAAACTLDPMLFGSLLPKLAATGRLCWLLDDTLPIHEADCLTWDEGPAWRFRPVLKNRRKLGHWEVRGELYRGDDARPLEQAVVLLARGLVVFPDIVARCDVGESFPWVRLLRETSLVEVPHDQRADLLRRLWDLPADDLPQFPRNLDWPQRSVAPRGSLRIFRPKKNSSTPHLLASCAFVYENQRVASGMRRMALVDEDLRRVVPRDVAAEDRLREELKTLGLRLSSPGNDLDADDATYVLSSQELPHVVRRLLATGWEVEAEGRQVRQSGACRLRVSSCMDWFELDGEFDFGDVNATLPELLRAVREGSSFVRLQDGSEGLLPEEWLQRFAGLTSLGAESPTGVRFLPNQAALLDAVVEAQDEATEVETDQRFADSILRVQAHQDVPSRPAPQEFRGQLRDYQSRGLDWLQYLRDVGLGGVLADDMGLGKTIQVLALLQAIYEGRASGKAALSPSLVVAPRSLVFNWLEEVKRFAPKLRVVNYTGLDRGESLAAMDSADLVITTYGTLRRDVLKLREREFEYVILDEAQAIKNPASHSARACRLLRSSHRLAMTGTPVENHLGDLWSLFEFLNPGLLGSSSSFQQLHQQAAADDETSLRLLSRALAPLMLRRTKQQVLGELPPKTEQTLVCELSPRERDQYGQLRDYYRQCLTEQIKSKGLKKSKLHVLEALLRLRQAACHPGLLDGEHQGRPSAKLTVLLEHLQRVVDEGHKALVFSQFTSLLGIVRSRLKERGVSFAYLDGRTRKRDERVREFQENPDQRVFLISLKAGGFGLNLTAADYVFILDPWWNPAVERQAVDRVHRIGQTRPVFAYRLIAGETVEQRIVELQESKRELAEALVGQSDSLVRDLTAEDLLHLLN